VPTGNFGDAYAAFVATRMGLPIAQIICATNSNDILARTFEEGRYAKGSVSATQSPAMDIQVASNFERLYFEAVRRDGVETGRAFRGFTDSGLIDIPPSAFAMMRELFRGASVSEADTAKTMLSTLNETGEVIDPHTAVGVAAAAGVKLDDPTIPVVVLSTAHPAKFPEAVAAACGLTPATPRATPDLSKKPERFERLPASGDTVKAFVRTFAATS